MATVFLNGRFIDRDQAMVSAFDAGFQHGVGLFETLLAVRGGGGGVRVLHLREHTARLAASARQLGLSDSLRLVALEEAIERTAAKAAEDLGDTARFRIRLTITGGDLNLLGRAMSGQPHPGSATADSKQPPSGREGAGVMPTLMIVAQPATGYPAEMFERGTSVVVADLRPSPLDPFQGHKTLNYWPRLRELQTAAGKRAGEALVFQVTNHLVGGCVSSAFLVKAGRLLTPIARGEEEDVATARDGDPETGPASRGPKGAIMPSPALPGIVRRWVMDWATAEGVEVTRRMLTIDDVLGADEVFLSNSSWGVMPVVKVESHQLGTGAVGEVSRRLIGAWRELTSPSGSGA